MNKLIMLLPVFLVFGFVKPRAQGSNYAVQSNIIFRFTKYIEWPAAKKTGDFVIGIVGDSPLEEVLRNFTTNKSAGNQKIVVKSFSSNLETYDCHILFIGEEEEDSIRKITLRTARAPILIVTESDERSPGGSCINFSVVSDHLQLYINKKNIDGRNMGIASELLQLGTASK
jgi:hypothetical protein